MIAFKKMWEDVFQLLSKDELVDINVTERLKSGFVYKVQEESTFITKEDFVDFWCKLLYFNEIDHKSIFEDGDVKKIVIYDILKKLPYVSDEKSKLKLIN